MTPTVALLTDFGLQDNFVGVMKGVMRTICPRVSFIDLSHNIAPQDVRAAAWSLLGAYRYFPEGTVFLVVVDPGVGTQRRAVAVQAGKYLFVAPDNGVLTYALNELKSYRVAELTNSGFQLPDVSQTFHGRDVFAPAAAYLALGVALTQFGSTVDGLVELPQPPLQVNPEVINGEVAYIDHFGNVITNIGDLSWRDNGLLLQPRFGNDQSEQLLAVDRLTVEVRDRTFQGVQRTYGAVQAGEPLALVSSGGFLEIGVNQGNCAAQLGISVGDQVRLRVG